MAKVLIADDSDAIRILLREVLEEDGLVVEEARDAASTQEALREHRIAVVLLDVHLGEVSGADLVARLRAPEFGSPRILLYSGMHPAELEDLSRRVGADGFVPKHAQPDEILDRITTAFSAWVHAQKVPGEGVDTPPVI